jgi:hypothetical protein
MPMTHASPLVKPWLGKDDPLISFLCDDNALYCSQRHSLSAVSLEPERLTVNVPPHKGTIAITGRSVRELCEVLCAGRATMIRRDGTDIASVTFLPDEEENVEL